MFDYLFKGTVDRLVDERLDEHLTATTSFHFINVDDYSAQKLITDFIVEQKEKDNKELSIYDFVVNLRLPAQQISKILNEFESSQLVKEL